MFIANRTSFYEQELNRVTEEYGNIVHVFSTYETKQEKDGKVTNRGINSFQLLKGKERYHIMNILWSAENDGFPLPQKYFDFRLYFESVSYLIQLQLKLYQEKHFRFYFQLYSLTHL